MSKRKKSRTSGEGSRPPKPPKNARLEESDGIPQSFELDHLHHPEETEGRSGPIPSADWRWEEPGGVASSFPDEEAGAPSRLLRRPEKEQVPIPPSQSSVGRFVPQYAKPRMTATQTETREEDLMSKAFRSETQPEPNAQQAGSQPHSRPIVQEAREPGDQPQADNIYPQHSDQSSETLVPSSRDSQPKVSPDISLERETVPSVSERISQNQLLEPGNNTPDGRSKESAWVPGGHSYKVHLSNIDAEEKPEQGSPQKGEIPQGARADLREGPQEEGEPRSVAQGLPNDMQLPSRSGREAEQNFSNTTCSSLGIVAITDVSTDPAEFEQRALEVAGPDGQAKARTPDRGHSEALLSCIPLTGKTTGDRGESGRGIEPTSDIPKGPEVTLAQVQGIQEPTVGAEHTNPPASEMDPDADQTQVSGLDEEGLGGMLLQPSTEKPAKLNIQSHEQDLKGLSLPLQASTLPVHREVVSGPQQTSTLQGSPDASAGRPKHPPDSTDQTAWGASPALEFDFLPDSQIWEALEAPDFEAPPEQLLPVGPHWPSASPSVDGGSLDETQQRTCMGIKAYEATSLEDATDTVRGLVIELSNLNRIIMSAHRNLEAFKCPSYYKAKSSGKASVPFASKETGNLPHGGLSWKDF
ncbi:break repair meiotic recombinase recruitment factor 1 [Talpa occidentalis]|uniref:break repair meiotic recombinase recruitment factor 1 n=1 Tax=Talpa occidentalis TaxID=50954 RepID=UPI00188EB2A9|nr:break repair meiotic recombinase recruitment factor 1 [Talpa occidentalis]